MSTDLTDARTALASLLNTVSGVRAVTVVPQTFTPPICWVAAGSPYRQAGQTFGQKKINLVVVCLGGLSTNDAAEDATEELAEKVADAIDASLSFRLNPNTELDQPRLYPSGQGQQMIGIAVNCWTVANRG